MFPYRKLAACALLATAPAFAAGDQPLFQWKSTVPLLLPKPDATHESLALKDPTIVRVNGTYHVFMTTASEHGGWEIPDLPTGRRHPRLPSPIST